MPELLDFSSGPTNYTTQLNRMEGKIDQILAGTSTAGLTFTPLTLSPSYAPYSTNGWTVAPSNLAAITDGDSNTSTNLFEIGGSAYRYGELIITPGITIPTYSRINLRVGLQNANNQRSYFELAAYNTLSTIWASVWATLDTQNNTTDLIVNIDRILPFSWNQVRFQLWDIGQFAARARIYDLRVWQVD